MCKLRYLVAIVSPGEGGKKERSSLFCEYSRLPRSSQSDMFQFSVNLLLKSWLRCILHFSIYAVGITRRFISDNESYAVIYVLNDEKKMIKLYAIKLKMIILKKHIIWRIFNFLLLKIIMAMPTRVGLDTLRVSIWIRSFYRTL